MANAYVGLHNHRLPINNHRIAGVKLGYTHQDVIVRMQ
jgi:hypothetical protein